jgi:hypothetical protein
LADGAYALYPYLHHWLETQTSFLVSPDVHPMTDRPLRNARIQSWLAADLDRVAGEMDGTKAQVNSAAVWWFCHRLTAEERARILGDFVAAQAMRGQQPDSPLVDEKPSARIPFPDPNRRKRPKKKGE